MIIHSFNYWTNASDGSKTVTACGMKFDEHCKKSKKRYTNYWGRVTCKTCLKVYAALCRKYPPSREDNRERANDVHSSYDYDRGAGLSTRHMGHS